MDKEFDMYNVCGASDLNTLVHYVNAECKKAGAEPFGGVCTFEKENDEGVFERHFIQAIVLYKKTIMTLQ